VESEDEDHGPRRFTYEDEKKKLPVLGDDGVFRTPENDGSSRLVKNRKRRDPKEGAGVKKSELKKDKEVKKRKKAEEDVPKARLRVASLATSITSNPTKNLKLMQELRKIRQETFRDRRVRGMALASEAQIFADISPGYIIKPLTDEEKAIKVSKEVLKTREFEGQLIDLYDKFLRDVVKLSSSKDPLALTSIQVLCAVLDALPHFNHGQTLAKTVVDNLEHPNPSIRELASTTLSKLYSEAHHAPESVLDVIVVSAQAIADLAEKKRHKLSESSIQPLTCLRLGALFGAANIAELKEERRTQGKKKKGGKYERELERDMMMARAETSSEARRKAADSLMSAQCLVYVRTLYNAPTVPSGLPSVLQGINNCSTYLSKDVVSALIDAISLLIEKQMLPLRSSLQTISSFFNLLLKHQQLTGFDPVEPTRLKSLMDIALAGLYLDSWKVSEEVADIAVRAVTSGLKLRRGDPVVWSSISRRMLLAALSSTNHSCSIAFLDSSRQAHPNPNEALDPSHSDLRRRWDPSETSPAANPDTTSWELVALCNHYHPKVRELANSFSLASSRAGPEKLLATYRASSGGFRPKIANSMLPQHRRKPVKSSSQISRCEFSTIPSDFLLQYYFNQRLASVRQSFESQRRDEKHHS